MDTKPKQVTFHEFNTQGDQVTLIIDVEFPLDTSAYASITAQIFGSQTDSLLDYKIEWQANLVKFVRDRGQGKRITKISSLNQYQTQNWEKIRSELKDGPAFQILDEKVLSLVHEHVSGYFIKEKIRCQKFESIAI